VDFVRQLAPGDANPHDLRLKTATVHLVGDGREPWAFNKECHFELRIGEEWSPYSLEKQEALPKDYKTGYKPARKGLKAIYLRDELLMAWAFCLESKFNNPDIAVQKEAWAFLKLIN